MQAAFGIIALTLGILSGAVSAVSAIGWLSDLPVVLTAPASASFGLDAATVSLVMIAGFGSTSILLLRAARRMLK